MIGMIKKDLCMMKNNYRSIAIIILIYIIYTVMFEMDMSFMLPLMALMISLSTLNYDDFNNWHAYASSFPQGRINVVKAKYITSVALVIITSIISIVLSFVIGNSTNNFEAEESLSLILGEITAIIFMMSVLIPVIFKYGSEKGRIVMTVLGIGIVGLVALISKFKIIMISASVLKFLNSNYFILSIIGSIILITISYNISKKIYLKKEF